MYFDERIAIFQMEEVETIKQILNENNLNVKRGVKTRLKEFKREWRQEMGGAGLDEDWRSGLWEWNVGVDWRSGLGDWSGGVDWKIGRAHV